MTTQPLWPDSLSLAQIHAALNEASFDGLPSWRVAVLRNITVEPIEPYWRYHAHKVGLNAELVFGDFDNVVQEALSQQPESLLNDADSVIIFLKLEELSPALCSGFASLSQAGIEDELQRISALIDTVLQGVTEFGPKMVLIQAFEQPIEPAFGAVDGSMPWGQVAVLDRLNSMLRDITSEHQGCFVVDARSVSQRMGLDSYYDRRFWRIGRSPYSGAALNELAREHLKFVRARLGKQKKCLILDCDNTLWGGIVGEDGLQGIKLGTEYPGSVYQGIQREILGLAKRGIILALASKNNPEDVWDVFDNHPDMVLKREHIAAHRINWDNKAGNILELVSELNIGMDSVVFVDDSEFELDLVSSASPEIEVLRFPAENPVSFEGVLNRTGLFDTLTVSDEDRQRNVMYQAEKKRKKVQADAFSLDDYYASLEMVLELKRIDEESLPRAAQLTQKTNQFNLTTRRYSEDELKKRLNRNGAGGLYVRVRDRFGDYGIVGIALVEVDKDDANIDTFLMSCRALGRRVESVLLRETLRFASHLGASRVTAEYIPSKKNAQTKAFYASEGFSVVGKESDNLFEYSLDRGFPDEPDIFSEIKTELDNLQT